MQDSTAPWIKAHAGDTVSLNEMGWHAAGHVCTQISVASLQTGGLQGCIRKHLWAAEEQLYRDSDNKLRKLFYGKGSGVASGGSVHIWKAFSLGRHKPTSVQLLFSSL